jgi:hypothetical protein
VKRERQKARIISGKQSKPGAWPWQVRAFLNFPVILHLQKKPKEMGPNILCIFCSDRCEQRMLSLFMFQCFQFENFT